MPRPFLGSPCAVNPDHNEKKKKATKIRNIEYTVAQVTGGGKGEGHRESNATRRGGGRGARVLEYGM